MAHLLLLRQKAAQSSSLDLMFQGTDGPMVPAYEAGKWRPSENSSDTPQTAFHRRPGNQCALHGVFQGLRRGSNWLSDCNEQG